MGDAESASAQRVRDKLAEPGLLPRLYRIAYWSTRNWASAQDLIADVIVLLFAGGRHEWDGQRPFLRFMSYMCRHVYDDQMRRKSAQELPHDGVSELAVSSDPGADEAIDQRRAEHRMARLRDKLVLELEEEEPDVLRSFQLMAEGLDEGQRATALGCSVDRVRAIGALIRRRGERLRAEWDSAERERMRAVQASAMKREEAEL
jgi:DNA-directed RNA polymerase specialized sigma24 family protein